MLQDLRLTRHISNGDQWDGSGARKAIWGTRRPTDSRSGSGAATISLGRQAARREGGERAAKEKHGGERTMLGRLQ